MSALVPSPGHFVDVLVVRNLPTKGGRCLVGYPLRRTGRGNGLVNVFMNVLPRGAAVKPGMRVRAIGEPGAVRLSLAEVYMPESAAA